MATANVTSETTFEDSVLLEIKTTFPKTTQLIGHVLKEIGSARLGVGCRALDHWMMEAFEELHGASIRLQARQA